LAIDIGSTKVCAVIAKQQAEESHILGVGLAKSQGIKKGVITNIDLASKAIKNAIEEAKKIAGTHFSKVIVSISGAYINATSSDGVVNVPGSEITIREINRVMEIAHFSAQTPKDYDKIHILPYNFKVDKQELIEDPLGMNGTRLEVETHIISAQSSSLNNLKKAIKSAGVEVDNIVYSGYAASLAVLNSDEKELGAAVIDMGGATCNLAIHCGNSIIYNDFLSVGSNNITSDLSMALHTPINAAEKLKRLHGSLKNIDSHDMVDLPIIGDDQTTQQVSLEIIAKVIYARAEEMLTLLAKKIDESGHKGMLGAGVVLTGGMSKLDGIRDLANAIFDGLPVRIAKPLNLSGLDDALQDPRYSTVIGLVLYGSGHFAPYEIDSNKKLRYKDEEMTVLGGQKEKQDFIAHEPKTNSVRADIPVRESGTIPKELQKPTLPTLQERSKEESPLTKFWNTLTQMF
jgi:cell division protein FtsA